MKSDEYWLGRENSARWKTSEETRRLSSDGVTIVPLRCIIFSLSFSLAPIYFIWEKFFTSKLDSRATRREAASK